MTKEIMTYIEKQVDYMNYCYRMIEECINQRDFNKFEYYAYRERFVTVKIFVEKLLEIFGLGVVKEEGKYTIK